MVALTAAAQSDLQGAAVPSASHTLDQTYVGPGFVEVAAGLDPGGAALGASSGPVVGRPGYADASGVGVAAGSHTLDQTYSGPGFAEVAAGLTPESAGLGTSSGPVLDRLTVGQEDELGAGVPSTDHDLTYPDTLAENATYQGRGFTESSYGIQPDGQFGTGSVIPTSYFRKIYGTVYDENDNPITDGLYVMATDNFSTAGPIDDNGEFELYLLRTDYSEFMLVAEESTTEGVDYIWYELAGNPDVKAIDR